MLQEGLKCQQLEEKNLHNTRRALYKQSQS